MSSMEASPAPPAPPPTKGGYTLRSNAGGAAGKRGRSPALPSPLSERAANSLDSPAQLGAKMALAPKILSTPGSGRHDSIRRRLRSPAMMSSPFKSSKQWPSNTPLKSSRKPGKLEKAPFVPFGCAAEDGLLDGISTLFVSPVQAMGPGMDHADLGSPVPLPLPQDSPSQDSPASGQFYYDTAQMSPCTPCIAPPCDSELEEQSFMVPSAVATAVDSPLGTPLQLPATVIEADESGYEEQDSSLIDASYAEDSGIVDASYADEGESYRDEEGETDEEQGEEEEAGASGEEGEEAGESIFDEGPREVRGGKVKPPTREGWDVAFSESSQVGVPLQLGLCR